MTVAMTTMMGGGGLIIDWNENNNNGVGSDFGDELKEDDNQTQRAICHGMGGTYDLFIYFV